MNLSSVNIMNKFKFIYCMRPPSDFQKYCSALSKILTRTAALYVYIIIVTIVSIYNNNNSHFMGDYRVIFYLRLMEISPILPTRSRSYETITRLAT